MSKQKAKGTRWESAIVAYLRDHGFPHAERRALTGGKDLGDINAAPGLVIEAKDQARHSFAEWLDEATTEGRNAHADVAAVWAHRRGKGSPGDAYVVMTGEQFVRLLRAAGYGSPLEDSTDTADVPTGSSRAGVSA